MFERLCGRLQDVRFLLLTLGQLVNDASILLIEEIAFAADVVDLQSQVVVDRQRIVEL